MQNLASLSVELELEVHLEELGLAHVHVADMEGTRVLGAMVVGGAVCQCPATAQAASFDVMWPFLRRWLEVVAVFWRTLSKGAQPASSS